MQKDDPTIVAEAIKLVHSARRQRIHPASISSALQPDVGQRFRGS